MDENQLAQLYQQYLGRAPDPSGIATWSGQDPSTVIAGILGSQEYQSRGGGGEPIALPVGGATIMPVGEAQSNQEKVDQLYRSILGRSAKDDPGSQGWVTLLESGASLENVASAIGSSQEAKNKALSGVSEEVKRNDPNNFAGKVTELYASALGRTPEPKALEEYVNILNRNPDEFGWLSTHVTSSPEAQKYAEKTGINLDDVRNNAVASYGLWTPAASSPTLGGLGGLFMKYGSYLPFIAAAAASAPTLLAAEGAAAGAAGGAGSTGALTGANLLNYVGLGEAVGAPFTAASGLSPELFTLANTAATTGGASLGFAAPGDEIVIPELAAQRAAALPNLYPGGVLPPDGYGTIFLPTGEAAYAPAADLAAYAAASPSLLSSLGNILSSPLGRLGAMGGLSLLSGGGQQQQPMPQMAGGGGTYAPRGQVDYTPILNLLAPRQIGRNSLLG